jgi:lipid-binding SYLF domain-containing protein
MKISESSTMKAFRLLCLLPLLAAQPAWSDEYDEALEVFRGAGASAAYFSDAYGYALFPTIGKGGFIVGGGYGKGRVYVGGAHVGDTTITQVSIGWQAGGQAYSEIIFLEDQRAFDEFATGNFELGAQANAVVITAGASAKATTGGATAGASGGRHDAATAGGYYKGMAVFAVAKGGLMVEASVAGQKFSYTALGATQ